MKIKVGTAFQKHDDYFNVNALVLNVIPACVHNHALM